MIPETIFADQVSSFYPSENGRNWKPGTCGSCTYTSRRLHCCCALTKNNVVNSHSINRPCRVRVSQSCLPSPSAALAFSSCRMSASSFPAPGSSFFLRLSSDLLELLSQRSGKLVAHVTCLTKTELAHLHTFNCFFRLPKCVTIRVFSFCFACNCIRRLSCSRTISSANAIAL